MKKEEKDFIMRLAEKTKIDLERISFGSTYIDPKTFMPIIPIQVDHKDRILFSPEMVQDVVSKKHLSYEKVCELLVIEFFSFVIENNVSKPYFIDFQKLLCEDQGK